MAESQKEFASLLTEALHRIKNITHQKLYEIEDELAESIYTTRETIEKWRRTVQDKQAAKAQKPKLMPSFKQAETIGKQLIYKGGLSDRREFEKFLTYAGHPYAAQAWIRLFPRIDRPPLDKHFIERKEKVEELFKALQQWQVVSLYGPSGVGKTTLVNAAIQQSLPNKNLLKQFPEGILYYNFYEHCPTDDIYRYIIDFFKFEVMEGTSPREAARKALQEKQVLLILDSAEEADNLHKVLEIRNINGVLVVTRDRLIAQRPIIYLDPPPLELATRILRVWSSEDTTGSGFRVWDKNLEVNQRIAEAICELVGRLPLALQLAGSYMFARQTSPAEYLKILTEETPLATLQESNDSIAILFEGNITKVSEAAQEVLAVVGLLSYAVPFELALVAIALDKSPSSTLLALNELSRFSLVKRHENGSYQAIHRLFHTYVKAQVMVPNEILVRLANHYTQLWRLDPNGYVSFEAELAHIMTVFTTCFAKKNWKKVCNLADILDRFLEMQWILTEERVNLNETRLTAARALQDPQEESISLVRLGNTYHDLRQASKAIEYYWQALKLALKIEGEQNFGEIFGKLADAYYMLGRVKVAIRLYQTALTAGDTGNSYLTGVNLGNLGAIYHNQGQIEQAIIYYEQALLLSRQTYDRRGEGVIVRQLGNAYRDLRQFSKAIEYYEKALRIAFEIHDQRNRSEVQYELGRTYAILSRYEEAIHAFEASLDLNPSNPFAYQALAGVYVSARQVEQAIPLYQRLVNLYPDDALIPHLWLGIIAYQQEEHIKARQHLNAVLDTDERVVNYRLYSLFEFLEAKAFALLVLGEKEQAIGTLQQAWSQRQPTESFGFLLYEFLDEAPQPPEGLDQMLSIFAEAIADYVDQPPSAEKFQPEILLPIQEDPLLEFMATYGLLQAIIPTLEAAEQAVLVDKPENSFVDTTIPLEILIQIMPCEEEVRKKALEKLPILNPEEQLALKQVTWDTITNVLRIRIRSNFDAQILKAARGQITTLQSLDQIQAQILIQLREKLNLATMGAVDMIEECRNWLNP